MQNQVFSMPTMQFFLGGLVLAVVSALYIFLTSLKKIPIFVAIFFTMIAFDYLFVIHYLFKKVSIPFVQSNEFLKRFKNRKVKSKWCTVFVKSCSPIKLGMGDGNFFDRLTSLVTWQFCVDKLVTPLFI